MASIRAHDIQIRLTPDAARTALRKHFEESSAGVGRLVMISGGITSGKTVLLNELLDTASTAGALTLSATGAPDERETGAAIIDQLLANSSLPIELPPHGGSIPNNQSGTEFLRRVCDALLDLARERPMVIGVDDLHFADETSLKLLSQLQRRIRSARLLIAMSHSNWPHASYMRLSTYFSRQPRHFAMQLAPMSEDDIAALLGQPPDETGASELPGRVHALTAGNPLLATALINDYQQGCGDGTPTAGAAYARAVYTFLDRPDTDLLEVAAAVAVLGPRHCGVELVAKLTGIDPDAVGDMLQAVKRSGLLIDGRFRHPSTEAAVMNSLPTRSRAALHGRAAKLLHRRAATATEVAAHLVAAGETPDAWAASVLRHAAEQSATADHDVPFATQCLELALAATGDEQERLAIKRSIVHVAWRVNPSVANSYAPSLREAAFGGSPDRAGCLALLRHALWHGDRQTFVSTYEVLRRSGEPIDPQTEVQLKLAYQWHFGPLPTTPDAAATGTHPRFSAEGHLRSAPWNRTVRVLLQARRPGHTDAANASAERVLQNCRLSDTALEALATALQTLMRGGKADRAEGWCARLSREARQRGAVTWEAMFEAVRAEILLWRGRPEVAAEVARTALDMLGEHNWGAMIALPLSTLLLADIAADSLDDAAKTLLRPVPDAVFGTVGALRYLRARGRYYLASSRPLMASNDFQKTHLLAYKWHDEATLMVPWRSDLAEANLQLGNVATARDLARQQVDLTADTDPYACGLALRVLALANPPAERAGLLRRAAKCFQDAGTPLELARTVAAAQHEGQGQRGDVAVLGPRRPHRYRNRPGAATNSAALAPNSTRVARPAPGTWPAPAPSPAPTPETWDGAERPEAAPKPASATAAAATAEGPTLSEAELRVAQLAAIGLTNRQISGRLYITVSTVEQHLTRVYRKLGIRGRDALGNELRLREPAPAEAAG